MPWRLIQFIFFLVIFLFFAGFNLDNKSDISFGFTSIKDVPVFFIVFFPFVFGMLCALPFVIRQRAKKHKNGEGGGMEKPKKSWKKHSKEPFGQVQDSSFSDGGPYGVN